MFINNFLEKMKRYVSSFLFPIPLALISFLIWIVPNPFNWIFISFYLIYLFLPLFSNNGKAYIPLVLFFLVSIKEEMSFINIPASFITIFSVLACSMIIFIFINKCQFKRDYLLVPSLVLLGTFFISYIYNSIEKSAMLQEGMLYLLYFFFIILLYLFFSTIIGQGESLSYLGYSLVFLSAILYLELTSFYIQNGYDLNSLSLSLGWSINKTAVTSFLALSIPFFIIMVNRKKSWYLAPLFLNILFLILLASDTSILFLIFFIIPIILLTFKSYKGIFPYITMLVLSFFVITFALLIILNKPFNDRILTAIRTLLFFSEEDPILNLLFTDSFNSLKTNPYVGKSINYYIQSKNYFYFSSNTYLTTLLLGGVFSLIAYLYFDIEVFYHCLIKKEKEKYVFLIFLLSFEFLGLISNTLYNLEILIFFLITISIYQMSNKEDDVIVHQDFPSYKY